MTPVRPFRPTWGVVALACYLWIIHSYKLAAGDLAVLALGIGVLRIGQVRLPAPLVFFGAMVLWACLGLTVTTSAPITTETLINLAKLWVIAFCAINVVRTAADLRFLAIVWLGVFALYPVRGALYNQYICHCSTFGRVSWNFIFSNPNDLATFSLLMLGTAAAVGYAERVKVWRYAAIAGVLVLSLLIMLTQSRSAMLGLGFAAVMIPLTSRRRTRDVLLLGLLVGVAAILAPKDVWRRLAGLGNVSLESGMQGVDPEGSAASRWQIWQVAFREIRAHPIMGVGAGMMPQVHREEALRAGSEASVQGVRDTHSTYLRLAAEIGVPGAALYVAMWGAVFARIQRARKRLRVERPRDAQALLFILLSGVAFLVSSVFGSYGAVSFTYMAAVFSWLAAAILERDPWYVPPRLART